MIEWENIQEAIEWLNTNSEEEAVRNLAIDFEDGEDTSIPYLMRLLDTNPDDWRHNVGNMIVDQYAGLVPPTVLFVALDYICATFTYGYTVGRAVEKVTTCQD